MTKIKFKMSFLLILIMISSIIFNPMLIPKAEAQSIKDKSFGGEFSRLLLDENNGYFYGISSGKLLFIRTKDLELEKEIDIPYSTDLEVYNNKLYIASRNKISVVNIQTKSIEDTHNINHLPYNMEIHDNKIFYALNHNSANIRNYNEYQRVYVYDLIKRKENDPIEVSSVIKNIAINKANSALYILQKNNYLITVETSQNNEKIYDHIDSFSFKYTGYNIIIEGNDLFYSNHRIDSEDLSKDFGKYDGYIHDVKDDYVITTKGIFDREKRIKVGYSIDFEFSSNMFLDNQNNIYIYDGPSKTLSKHQLDKFIFEEFKNGGGFEKDYVSGIDYNYDIVKSNTEKERKSISKWIADEENRAIYAIAQKSDNLMIISLDDLKLQKEIAVGKDPNNLQLIDGKLYIMLNESNQIKVFDTKANILENNIVLSKEPNHIAIDGDKLYYVESQYKSIFEHNLKTNEEKEIKIKKGNYYAYISSPQLTVDIKTHVLYVGAKGGSEIFALNTANNQTIYYSNNKDMYKYSGVKAGVLLDGANLFYGKYKLNAKDLSTKYGFYLNEIIYADRNYVYSNNSVYDKEKFIRVADFPFESENVFVDNNYNVYLFDKETNSFKKESVSSLIDRYNSFTIKKYEKGIDYHPLNIEPNSTSKRDRIDKWFLDEGTGLIYAIPKSSNKVLVIDSKDLKQKKELIFHSQVLHMEADKGRLYVSTAASNYIEVIDLGTQAHVDTVLLSYYPDKFIIQKDKLSSLNFKPLRIKEYDLKIKTEREINIANSEEIKTDFYYYHNLLVDKERNILYIDDITRIYAISLDDYKLLESANYYNSKLTRNELPIINNNNIYFHGYRLDSDKVSNSDGVYSEEILGVIGKYAVSRNFVYDKDSFMKIGDLPFYLEKILIDKEGNIYSFKGFNNTITKNSFSSLLDRVKNKNDNLNSGIDYNLFTAKDIDKDNRLSISKWLIDEENRYIYGLSKENNSLLFIGLDDLKLKGKIFFSKEPIEIKKKNNKLYIACSYSNDINIVDIKSKKIIDKITMLKRPERIALGEDKVYYIAYDENKLLEYDLTTKKEKETFLWRGEPRNSRPIMVDEGDLVLDTKNNVLYLGTRYIVPKCVYAIDLTNYKMIGFSDNNDVVYGFHSPERRIIKEGNEIFFDKHALDANNLSINYGAYGGQIITVNRGFVLTNNEIYNRNSFKKVIDLPFETEISALTTKNEVVLYDKNTKTISKYDIIDNSKLSPSEIIESTNEEVESEEIVKDEIIEENINDNIISKPTLPPGTMKLEGIINDLEKDIVEYEINEIDDLKSKQIKETLKRNDIEIVSEPIEFKLQVRTQDKIKEVESFGSEYFRRWILLKDEPDKANTIGIFYDEKSKKYKHVPTIFLSGNDGRHWAIMMQNGKGTYGLVNHSKEFDDIKEHWAKKDIELLASKLIVNGMNDSQFVPNEKVTRAQYIALLVRSLGLITREKETSTFKDVSKDDWYHEVVETAKDMGLINGYEDDTFKPDKFISREEMTILTAKALKLIAKEEINVKENLLEIFEDKDKISNWAKESVAIAVENGIIKGQQDNMFSPKTNATRAESVIIIRRLLENLYLIDS